MPNRRSYKTYFFMAKRKKELTFFDVCGVPDCNACTKISCIWHAERPRYVREVLLPRIRANRISESHLKVPIQLSLFD